ncbi:MAG: zinc-ribbon domain-containing protein [Acidimicrobiia bacterium]|nr:zinc-ribbon domain-containing protein [Acidimicrobiia bacterium]
MYCHHCGAAVDNNAKFCPACGKTLNAGASGGPPPLPAAPVPFTPPERVEVRVWHWIDEGWKIVKQDMGNFALMTIVMVLLSGMVPLILQGAMVAGFHIVVMRKMLVGRVEFGDLFKGFNDFVPCLVASLLISLFTFLGILACIIPGLVIAAMYFFTYLFIVDRKMDFWPAMQASHELVKKDYVGFTLLLLAFIPLHLLGALACLVGLLWTVPVQYAAITVAYKELVGFASPRVD